LKEREEKIGLDHRVGHPMTFGQLLAVVD